VAIGQTSIAPAAPTSRLRSLLLVAAGLAVLGLAAERVCLALVQPLWFDEAWALAVATAPDWRTVVHEAYADVNAPLFYLFAHAWTALAGPSDFALRLPSLVAVAIAGAIPLLGRVEGLSRDARLAWAAMIFAWWGVDVFLAGRCYGPLLALSVWQAVLYAELVRAPDRHRALAWSAVAALAVLTHYFALIPTAVQGVIFLATRGRRALRTWPAALAFAPTLAWIAWHAPRLRQFASESLAWHPPVDAIEAVRLTGATLLPSNALLGLAVAALAVAAGLGWRARSRRDLRPAADHLWVTAAASLLALVLALAIGAVHASLTDRYLIPLAPGLLLGLVLCARRTARPQLACAALAGVYLLAAVRPAAFEAGLASRSPYGFEAASSALMRAGVSDVVFIWDHEVDQVMEPASLARVGDVFFARAGRAVRVRPLQVAPSDDVSRRALVAAVGPRPGVVWIYNRDGHTAASARPPRIAALDPRWRCARWGDERVGSLACWRAAP
jgi:mannosyltransferase